jgi:hypothetical protein
MYVRGVLLDTRIYYFVFHARDDVVEALLITCASVPSLE